MGQFYLVIESKVNFYLTFTAPNKEENSEYLDILIERYGKEVLNDSFIIGLIQYNALPFVDKLPERNL